MQNKALIEKLQQLGFKEYESKVFLVLLKNSILSASDIADKANIRRTAVYEILKTFAARGFCNEIETNTVLKYEIIDPRIILDKIARDIKNEKETRLDQLKETFKELEPLHKTEKDPGDNNINIELIRGFNKHRHTKFLELFKAAKKEVLFMIRFDLYVSEELDNTAKAFFKKGGVIKSIYEATSDFKIIKENDKWEKATMDDLIRICKKFEKYGEDLKISEKPLPNITIFDREIVFVNITDKNVPRHNNADIIIKNKEFSSSMIDLFQFHWNESYKIKEFEKKYKSSQ